MKITNLPLKEAGLIFLFIALSMSLSNLQLKDNIVRDIAMHPWIRFLIIFLTAFMIFSLDIDSEYSFGIRLIVAALIALVVQTFLAANTTMFALQPMPAPLPEEEEEAEDAEEEEADGMNYFSMVYS